MRHASAGFWCSLRKMIFSPSSQEMHPKPHPSIEKGIEEVNEGFPPLFYLGLQVEEDDVRVLLEFTLLVTFIILLPLSISTLTY